MSNLQLIESLKEVLLLAERLSQKESIEEKVKALRELESRIGRFIEYHPIYLEEKKDFTEKYVKDSGGYSTPSIPIVERSEVKNNEYKEKGFQILTGSLEVGRVSGIWILESGRFLVIKSIHYESTKSYYDDSSGPRIYYPYTYQWKGEAEEVEKLPDALLKKRVFLDLIPSRRVTDRVIKKLCDIKEINDSQRDTILFILKRTAQDSRMVSLSEFFTGLSSKSIEVLGKEGLGCLILNLKNIKFMGTPWSDQDRKALVKFKENQVVDCLLQILKDESIWKQAQVGYPEAIDSQRACELLIDVIKILEDIGDRRVVKPLIEIMRGGAVLKVKGEAAAAIGKICDEEAFIPVVKIFAGLDKAVNEAGRKADMGYGSKPDKESVRFRDIMRGVVAEISEKVSNKSLDSLLQLLDSDNYTERSCAVKGLKKLEGDKVIDTFVQLVKNESKTSGIRFEALDTLGRFNSEKAVEVLIQISRDKNDPLRLRAAGILKQIGKSPSFLRRLLGH